MKKMLTMVLCLSATLFVGCSTVSPKVSYKIDGNDIVFKEKGLIPVSKGFGAPTGMIVGTIGGGALTGSPVGAIAGGVTGGIAGSKLCANETTRVNAEELRQYLNQAAAQVNGQGQQQGIFMGNTAEGYAVFAPLPQVQTPVANGGFGTRPTYCSPQVGGQGQVGVQPQPAYRPPVAVPQPSYGQPVYQQQPTMAQVQPPPQMAPGQQAPVVVNIYNNSSAPSQVTAPSAVKSLFGANQNQNVQPEFIDSGSILSVRNTAVDKALSISAKYQGQPIQGVDLGPGETKAVSWWPVNQGRVEFTVQFIDIANGGVIGTVQKSFRPTPGQTWSILGIMQNGNRLLDNIQNIKP